MNAIGTTTFVLVDQVTNSRLILFHVAIGLFFYCPACNSIYNPQSALPSWARRLLDIVGRYQRPWMPLPLRRAAHNAAVSATCAALGPSAAVAAAVAAAEEEPSPQLRYLTTAVYYTNFLQYMHYMNDTH